MRKIALLILVAVVYGLALACDDGSSDDGATVIYSDEFNYTTGLAWTPENGWYCSTISWDIMPDSGVTGSALRSNGSHMLSRSISGTDYQATIRFRAATLNTWHFIYLAARVQDDDNWYAAGVSKDIDGNMYLVVTKNSAGAIQNNSAVQFITGALDPAVYYTLTIKVAGSVITAVCSGGGHSAVSTSMTDSAISGGKIGILVYYTSGGSTAFFDDLLVTEL